MSYQQRKHTVPKDKQPVKSFGGLVVYNLYEDIDETDRKLIEVSGIQEDTMTLQELFVMLTKGERFNL